MSKRIPYAEQLKHPMWQRRRLEVLGLAEFRCENCGSGEKTLHVHHSYYVRGLMAWEYPGGALKALCGDCHGERAELEAQLLTAVRNASNGALTEFCDFLSRRAQYDEMDELLLHGLIVPFNEALFTVAEAQLDSAPE